MNGEGSDSGCLRIPASRAPALKHPPPRTRQGADADPGREKNRCLRNPNTRPAVDAQTLRCHGLIYLQTAELAARRRGR